MQQHIDIGAKIKQARTAAGITQEDAADALGVSRQTISNWENEKTYPDIISVITMSDLYHVSLDHLLKEDSTMNQKDTYMEYLKESTDVVLSNEKKGKLYLVLTYLAIWGLAMIVFWFFTSGSDAMGYGFVYLWILLPVTTFVISLLIGLRDYWKQYKWFGAFIMGLMYMLAEYATFSAANMISFNKINMPELPMLLTGAFISLAGMYIGTLLRGRKQRKA